MNARRAAPWLGLVALVVFESRGAELHSVTSVADAGRTLVLGSDRDDRVGLLDR